MTDIYMFDDADLQDKIKELKKELKPKQRWVEKKYYMLVMI